MPRKKRKKNQANGVPSWILALGAILAISALIGAFLWRNQTEKEMAMNKETLCPLAADGSSASAPTAMTVILFDLTDPISPAQRKQLTEYIEQELVEAPRGTQFTLGVVNEDSTTWGASAPLCKPFAGKDVMRRLDQNQKLVQKRYENQFLSPLRGMIREMLSAKPANHSPIMEALQSLLASTPGFLTFPGPRRLIVVSDLLQNSDVFNFYRGDDWQAFKASPSFQRLGHNLKGADVKFFQIPRSFNGINRPAMVRDFWVNYCEVQGCVHLKFIPLEDL